MLAGIQEQRRARRWGIFFKLLTFLLLVAVLLTFTPLMDMERNATTGSGYSALIEVRGVIADKEQASADNLVTSLQAAFDDPKVKGVVLRINSPGGSPVQSGYVYDEIRRLRGLHPETKVYAVISDLGASGAYYIASAADGTHALALMRRHDDAQSLGDVAGRHAVPIRHDEVRHDVVRVHGRAERRF